MATKKEMLADLEALGVMGYDEDFSWAELADVLSQARVGEISAADTEGSEDSVSESGEAPEPSPRAEPKFTVEELRPYSKRLFGVPSQVLVGARSAGLLKEPTTKADAAVAVRRYLERS